MKVKYIFGMTCALLTACIFAGCDEQKEFDVDKHIYLDCNMFDLYYGDKVTVKASPGSAAYQWTSEDEAIATVTGAGEIEAVGVGTTDVVVSNGNVRRKIPVKVTIPSADRITGRPGMDRAAIELDIRSNLIQTVKITRLDTEESVNYDVDFKAGIITAFYNNLTEAKYSFRVVCIDKYGMESTPVNINVQVYGDIYRSKMTIRPFKTATAFGNGLAIGWGNPAGSFVDVYYTNKDGEQATMRTYADESASHLLDCQIYPATDFSYVTGYVPEAAVDTFYTAAESVSATQIGFKQTFLSKDAPAEVFIRDFDLGGEGIGYHDNDAINSTGNYAYRENLGDYNSRGVDIETGLNIGYVNPGEWLAFTVNVKDAGRYVFDVQAGVQNSAGGKFFLVVDDERTEDYPLKSAGNWTCIWHYQTNPDYTPPVLDLTEGLHTIKWQFVNGNTNLMALRFTYEP